LSAFSGLDEPRGGEWTETNRCRGHRTESNEVSALHDRRLSNGGATATSLFVRVFRDRQRQSAGFTEAVPD